MREIILAAPTRLEMGSWHGDDSWENMTCAEHAVCNTAHCMAGHLQACSDDPEIRAMSPARAGFMCAPIASGMFYQSNARALKWLTDREYAKEGAA